MGAQPSLPDNAAAPPPSANSPQKSPFTNVPLWPSQRVTSTAAPQSPATALTSSVTQAVEQSGMEEGAARAKNNNKGMATGMATGTVTGRTVAAMQIGPLISLRAVCRPAQRIPPYGIDAFALGRRCDVSSVGQLS